MWNREHIHVLLTRIGFITTLSYMLIEDLFKEEIRQTYDLMNNGKI